MSCAFAASPDAVGCEMFPFAITSVVLFFGTTALYHAFWQKARGFVRFFEENRLLFYFTEKRPAFDIRKISIS